MSREITHMKAFTAALESMGKPMFSIGCIPPTPILVDQYFNDSTGVGDRGEPEARGPWNEGGSWEFVNAPAFQQLASHKAGTRASNGKDATPGREQDGGKELKGIREKPKTVETSQMPKKKRK